VKVSASRLWGLDHMLILLILGIGITWNLVSGVRVSFRVRVIE